MADKYMGLPEGINALVEGAQSINDLVGYEPNSRDLFFFVDNPIGFAMTDSARAITDNIATYASDDFRDLEFHLGTTDLHIQDVESHIQQNNAGAPDGLPLYSHPDMISKSLDAVISMDPKPKILAENLKQAASSYISHELRTPLAVVIGYSSLGDEMFVPDIQRNLAQLINKNRQIEMYDRLLKNQSVDIQATDFARVFQSVRDQNVGELVFEGTDEDTLVSWLGESPELGYVVNELINNAVISHKRLSETAEKGAITIAVEESEQSIQVHVVDSGTGFSDFDPKRVYIPFDKYAKDYKNYNHIIGSKGIQPVGAGLGLPIAKMIAEENGFDLQVRNREDRQGAVGTITIPKA